MGNRYSIKKIVSRIVLNIPALLVFSNISENSEKNMFNTAIHLRR